LSETRIHKQLLEGNIEGKELSAQLSEEIRMKRSEIIKRRIGICVTYKERRRARLRKRAFGSAVNELKERSLGTISDTGSGLIELTAREAGDWRRTETRTVKSVGYSEET
jgi:hypothetical protein